MSNWNEFYRLSSLRISFKDSLSGSAIIYGNSRNQIAISIYVNVMASVTEELKLTEDELFDALYLCHYRDGTRLSDDWELTRVPGNYVGAVNLLTFSDTSLFSDNGMFLTCYLSCKKAIPSTLIALGIDIPGIGKFNTSEYGTSTINAPAGQNGSVFKSPQNITLSTLESINYGVASNLSISNGWNHVSQMILVSETLPCNISSNHSSNEGSIQKGKAYYKTLRIASKAKHPFKTKIVEGSVNTIPGYTLAGRDDANGADLIFGFNTRDKNDPKPVQVFDTSLVFLEANSFGVKSSENDGLSIVGENYQYVKTIWKLKIPIKNKIFSNTIENKSIAVSTFHIRHCAYFYTGEEWQADGWSNYNERIIKVWDVFGNTGDITLSVSNDKKNISELIINGVMASEIT